MIFMNLFLKTKIYCPISSKISYILFLAYFISVGYMAFQNFKFSYFIVDITAMLGSIYLLIIPIMVLMKGYKPAKYFLIAWLFFCLV